MDLICSHFLQHKVDMERAECSFEAWQLGQGVIVVLCREWYGYHFPELVKIINDNATYCRLAQFIGNRKELNEEKLEKLEELTMDAAKAKAILDASRSSMGQYRA